MGTSSTGAVSSGLPTHWCVFATAKATHVEAVIDKFILQDQLLVPLPKSTVFSTTMGWRIRWWLGNQRAKRVVINIRCGGRSPPADAQNQFNVRITKSCFSEVSEYVVASHGQHWNDHFLVPRWIVDQGVSLHVWDWSLLSTCWHPWERWLTATSVIPQNLLP
jgi:hypothetical protein